MEEEEPEAARIICIALNKKNEVAMETGHLEIMATLASLCKPDPHNEAAPFVLVIDALIDLYGAAVGHPEFVYVYRYVMAAGGACSVHIDD